MFVKLRKVNNTPPEVCPAPRGYGPHPVGSVERQAVALIYECVLVRHVFLVHHQKSDSYERSQKVGIFVRLSHKKPWSASGVLTCNLIQV